MVHVKRKNHETTGSMIRRFTRRVQLSGVLRQMRKNRFYVVKPTKRAVLTRALRRNTTRQERERLDKLGKLPQTQKGRRR